MKYKLIRDLIGHKVGEILTDEEWKLWLHRNNFSTMLTDSLDWFEPVIEFEVGQWLYEKMNYSEILVRYKSTAPDNCINTDEYYQICLVGDKIFGEGFCYSLAGVNNVSIATPQQIESVLSKVTRIKGYKNGTQFRSAITNDIAYISNDKLNYLTKYDALFINGCSIYAKGKWATILPEEKSIDWKKKYYELHVKYTNLCSGIQSLTIDNLEE